MLRKLSLLFLIFFGMISILRASHVPGGNITYECIGNNQYLLTLTLFEDCGTAFEAGGNQTISITNDCGFVGTTTISLSNTIFQQEVSQLCASQLPFSECSGGALPGIYMHQWTGVITLPGQCDSWTFSYSSCCRNTTSNLTGTDAYYYESVLNSSTAPCNNSPSVTTQMIPYVCVGQPLVYNLGIYEPDGNTLAYSLVNALSGAGTSVNYQIGYTGTIPIPSMVINSTTGNLSFTPSMIGNFVVSVLVEEFNSSGDLVGSIIQDFQFEVINCPANTNPVEPTGIINYTGDGAQVSADEIEVCAGDDFCFQLEFTDLNSGDSIFISSNLALALPGATFTQLTWQSPALAEICWTATSTVPSNTTVVFNARDNACPMFGITFYPIKINISPGTYAGPDQTLCAGDTAWINVTGGTVFTWEAIPGGDTIIVGNNFTCNTCQNVGASPAISTSYEVTSNLSASCNNIDTVVVNVVPDFAYSLTQSSTVSCINSEIYFESLPSPAGSYQYSWSPSSWLDDPNIPNPVVTPTSPGEIDFAVEIMSSTGCIKYDTLSVTVSPNYAPEITMVADPISVTCGDTVFLATSLDFSPITSCGPSANTNCGGLGAVYELGDSIGQNTNSTYPSPFGNWYRNARHQFLFTASELTNAGLVPGKITELAWEVTQLNGTSTYNGYTVEMGCTSNSGLTVSWEVGLTTVFSPQNIVITPGWNTLTLTTAYEWDGLSNLVVDICYDNLSVPYTLNSVTPWTATTFNSSSFYYSDGTAACPVSAASNVSIYRPVTRFTSCVSEPDIANYTFEWIPTSSVDDPNAQNTFALPMSNVQYQVVATDLNGGCTDTASVDITVVCCETPLVASVNSSCYGFNDGSVEITPVSSIPTTWIVHLIDDFTGNLLQYDSNAIAAVNFYGLAPGDYLIETIDLNGCIGDTLITITEPSVMSVSVTNDTSLCYGDSLQLSASGGAIYSWIPTTHIATPSNATTWYYGVTSEMIYINVTDTNGCSEMDSVFVTVNALPTITISNDTTICISDTVQLTAGGGIGYLWSPSSSVDVAASATVNAFPQITTTFQVTVSNASNCVDSAQVTITLQTLPLVNAGVDTMLCVGDTIGLQASGATNYLWNSDPQLSHVNVSNPDAFPSITTDFVVVGFDALGCENSDTIQVLVNDLPSVDAGEDVWLCPGSSVTLLATGGIGYEWSPITDLSNPLIANPDAEPLDTTLYSVIVTDINNCQNTDSVTVYVSGLVPTDAGDSLTICEGDTSTIGGSPTSVVGTSYDWQQSVFIVDATQENPSVFPNVSSWFYVITSNDTCHGLDSVFVTVNPYPLANAGTDVQICIGDTTQLGGSGGVSYLWNQAVIMNDAQIDTPLTWPSDTTDYILIVTDANGCSQSDTMQVVVNPLPNADAGVDQVICYGDTAVLIATGGQDYSWSAVGNLGTPLNDTTVAHPGNTELFYVDVTDSNGCVQVDSVTVVVNSLPVVNAGVDESICIYDSIQLNGSGALIYAWIPSVFLSDTASFDPWASPQITSDFILEGIDVNGCVNWDTMTVVVNDLPLMNAGEDVQICIGDTTQLNAGGANSYQWSPSAGLSDAGIDDPLAFPTDTTEYIVLGTDLNGCKNEDSVTVIVNPLPTVVPSADVDICLGDTTLINASGGDVYAWEPTLWSSTPNSATTLVFPDTSTYFVVTVTDSNGCVNWDSTLVNVFRVRTIPDTTICKFDTVYLDIYGSPGNQFDWSPGTYLSSTTVPNPYSVPLESITYTVTVTDVVGCVDQDSVSILVNEVPIPDFSYEISPSCEGMEVSITNSSEFADDYSWSVDGTVLSDESDPLFLISYDSQHEISLGATNNYGCVASMDTIVVLDSLGAYYSIYIPNVFTPNGDGENDRFWVQVPGSLATCVDLSIYNRWGQLLFKSAGSLLEWDGKTSVGEEVPNGTYLYTIEVKDWVYEGTLTLFR